MASAQQKAKKTKGERNDVRPNGKAWKKGKHPDVREAEARAHTRKTSSG